MQADFKVGVNINGSAMWLYRKPNRSPLSSYGSDSNALLLAAPKSLAISIHAE